MTNEVFISHCTEDGSFANQVCTILEQNGVRCWIAPRDITPGSEWMAAIIEGIDMCKLMILIFSASANRSSHVRREVERAISKELIILPFRVEDVEPTGAFEYAFSGPQRLDAFDPPLSSRLDELASAVTRLLGKEFPSNVNAPPSNPTPPTISGHRFTLFAVLTLSIVLALSAFAIWMNWMHYVSPTPNPNPSTGSKGQEGSSKGEKENGIVNPGEPPSPDYSRVDS